MPYVERDENQKICGVFANPQPGYAEEFLTAEDGELIAYLTPPAPESVSSRQFKLQLLAAGLLDQVDAWVAAQDRATQIAYEYSGTFVRSSPMMQDGFSAMGFTPEQIEAFFVAASKL